MPYQARAGNAGEGGPVSRRRLAPQVLFFFGVRRSLKHRIHRGVAVLRQSREKAAKRE